MTKQITSFFALTTFVLAVSGSAFGRPHGIDSACFRGPHEEAANAIACDNGNAGIEQRRIRGRYGGQDARQSAATSAGACDQLDWFFTSAHRLVAHPSTLHAPATSAGRLLLAP